MKKLLVLITVCSALLGISVCASDADTDIQYISDGYISIEESFALDREGEKITAAVVRNEINLTDENDFLLMSPADVVYYEMFTLDAGKTVDINFRLGRSGLYKYYTFSKVNGEKVKKLKYISKAAIDDIRSKTSAADVKSALESKAPEDLGIFGAGELYANIDRDKFSELLYNSLSGNADVTDEDAVNIIGKAFTAELLNESKLNSFYVYSDISIFDDDIFEFITTGNEGQIIAAAENNNITNAAMLDNILIEKTALNLANSSDTSKLKSFLEKYKTHLGISKTITQELCNAIISGGNYANIGELTYFINNYVPANDNKNASGGSGGFGGGGGGGGGGGNSANGYGGAVVAAPVSPTGGVSEIDVFDDIAGVTWASEAITSLYKKNVINGKAERLFYPNDSVTREEFTKILISAFNMKLVDEDVPFTDVTDNDWSYKYIKTAYLSGIVKGISDTVFGKEMNITRQDLAVMVHRTLALVNCTVPSEGGLDNFADSEDIAEYAKEAVGSLYNQGIISGNEVKKFNSEANASRAEAAKIVYYAMRIYELNR